MTFALAPKIQRIGIELISDSIDMNTIMGANK